MCSDLTQELLKKHIEYTPNTGIFTRRRSVGGVKEGAVTGYVRRDGYVEIGVDYKLYLAHRLAVLYMTGSFPKYVVDHINRNPSDNRWANLRECTYSENSANTRLKSDNTSGFRGVTWHKQSGKWLARIYKNGVQKSLGLYATKSVAAEAYGKASADLYGEFSTVKAIT